MKQRLMRYILLFVAVAAVATVGLTLLNRANSAGRTLPIETYTVGRGSLVEQITGTGTFKPQEAVTIPSRLSGQIQSIPVEEGDRVEAGALLVLLDPNDSHLAVNQAKSSLETTRRSVRQSIVTLRAGYRSALTTFEQAKRSYEKNKELFAGKAISGDELAASEDSYTTASVNLQSTREQLNLRLALPLSSEPVLDSSRDEAIIEASPEVVQAEVGLQSARDNLDKCTVRAPFAGTVTQVVPNVGDLVQPNAPLVRIEDLSDMLAEVQIDEVDIGKLIVGNAAEITSDSLIGRTLHGKVLTIAPTISAVGSTRVSKVEVSLDAADGGLRSGASCSVKITTRTKADVVNIPITAFVSRGGGERVFALVPLDSQSPNPKTGNDRSASPSIYRLEERVITTGVSTINSIEVTSGLKSGELIADGALNQLRIGMLVTPKERL